LRAVDQLVPFMENLVRSYGYFGVFLVLLISNASILFPLPGIFIVFVAGAVLDPRGVAIAAGLGAAIGEFTGYLLGVGGGKLIQKRAAFNVARNTFKRYGSWAIFVFASLPLPFDVVGMLSGALGVHALVFFVLTFAGKTTAYMLYAFTGREVTQLLTGLLEGRVNAYTIGFLIVMAVFVSGVLLFWNYLLKKNDDSSGSAGKL